MERSGGRQRVYGDAAAVVSDRCGRVVSRRIVGVFGQGRVIRI